MLVPVQEGTHARLNIAPGRFNGTRTFSTITYISNIANRSDIQFPFSRSYGLEYLDLLANSTPPGKDVNVTLGAPQCSAAHWACVTHIFSSRASQRCWL